MANLNSIGGIHYEMMKRCYNKKSPMYKDYGAKGITVCKEWHDRENFKKWANENGYVKNMRLERIDGKGNYEPCNCVFGNLYSRRMDSWSQKQKKYHKERMDLKKKAGIDGNISEDAIYKTYQGMHLRCENKNHINYDIYGGRGIKVCDEWSGKTGFINFRIWANENGWEKGLTIDRIDPDKGYYPSNCRWATMKEQIQNRRISKNYMYHGEKVNLMDIAELENLNYGMLYNRITRKNMSIDDAISDVKKKICSYKK